MGKNRTVHVHESIEKIPVNTASLLKEFKISVDDLVDAFQNYNVYREIGVNPADSLQVNIRMKKIPKKVIEYLAVIALETIRKRISK